MRCLDDLEALNAWVNEGSPGVFVIDGKISRDEAPEQMKTNFDMMDGDKDGFIDAKEIAELRKKFGGAGGGQGKKKADPGGAKQE